MKDTVVCYAPLAPATRHRLGGFDVRDFDAAQATRHNAAFMAALRDATAVIGSSLAFDAAMIAACPRLRLISSVSVGVDQYDVGELTRRGILLCHTPDVLTDSVADLAMALMLACARRVVTLATMVQAGKWRRSVGAAEFGRDVHGATLGVIGMGRIGAALARRAVHGFGMRLLYQSRSAKPEVERDCGAQRCSLDELLTQSDFVCVLTPLSAETEKLIGARELALMQRDAYLINVARGRVVDEAALIEALQQRRIAGAGLDVFEREPLPADSLLLQMANVVALPHVGSATTRTRAAMAEMAVDNLIAAWSGTPRAMINPQAWPKAT